jgi:hypothetical protein
MNNYFSVKKIIFTLINAVFKGSGVVFSVDDALSLPINKKRENESY